MGLCADPVQPGWKVLMAYALPAVPLSALALPLYIIVPTFYADNLGLSLSAVGLVLVLLRLMDALTDPVFGWLADRSSMSIGRRRGFFLISLPVTAFAAFMLFWPPMDAGLAYLAIWGSIVSIGYTWTILPYTAWGSELVSGYQGRALVTGWRESFALVGTLVAIVLPFAVGLDPTGGFHGLASMGVAVLIALPLAGLIAVAKVPEPGNPSVRTLNILNGLAMLTRNRPFLRLIAAFLLNGFANAVPATLFLYFVSDRLEAEPMRGPLLFLYFLCAIAGVPIAVQAARMVGKHRAWCYAMVLACLIFMFAAFLRSGDVLAFGLICAATGLLLGFDLALPPAIQSDVIDNDTALSGEQRSGFYFAAWSLATKLSLALAVGAVFPLLAWAGFASGAVSQPEFALSTLSLLYGALPIIPKLGAIALMWNFPIDAIRQAELRAVIEAR